MTWGDIAYMRGFYFVQLSPFELKASPKMFQKHWQGFRRDMGDHLPYWGPALLATYLIMAWGNKQLELNGRKKPSDYVNDV